jgi:hypothetical protein
MRAGINDVHTIPEMIAEVSYLFAIVCRLDMGIQYCSEVRGFLFDDLRI